MLLINYQIDGYTKQRPVQAAFIIIDTAGYLWLFKERKRR